MMKPTCLFLSLVLVAIPSRLCAQVPYARIVAAVKEPGCWLTYSGNYAAHRFSPLGQLTAGNVAGLKPVWIYQVKEPGLVASSPANREGDRLSQGESWGGPPRPVRLRGDARRSPGGARREDGGCSLG